MSIILRMKFQMFLLSLLGLITFMFFLIIQRLLNWIVYTDLAMKAEREIETLEETLAREVEEAMAGRKVEATYPDMPVMVWWTPFTGDDGVQQCGEHRCYVTNDRHYRHHPMQRALFFYGSDFKPYDAPLLRKPTEDWALFHEESPKNNPIFSHEEIMSLFNHTSTFRRISDYPLTTQGLEGVGQITDPNFLIPLHVKNRMISEGLASVAYVQSGCDTPSGRDHWVKQLMKHIKVDSYGACLNNKEMPQDIKGSHKMDSKEYLFLLAKYKFIITFENAVCPDYVTEKLWKALQVGAVPIYYGAPNVEDYLPNPKSAVLVKDFDSVEAVAEHIKRLDRDEAEYKSYLGHKLAHNRQAGPVPEN